MTSTPPSFLTQYLGGRACSESEQTVKHEAPKELGNYNLRLKVFTLNINGGDLPDDVDVLNSSNTDLPDLVVFCFQEVIKLSLSRLALDLVSGRNRGERCDKLRKQVRSGLPSIYQEVHAEEMVGLFIVAFCTAELSASLQYTQSVIYATGMGGLGNKGACAIRLRFSDTTLVFVNAHLASSEDELERRNDDMKQIDHNLAFPAVPISDQSLHWKKFGVKKVVAGYVESKSADTSPLDVRRTTDESKNEAKHRFSILDSHILFVAGDLNYHIELEHDEVISLIERKNYESLLKFDQLRAQSGVGEACSPYKEANIDFRPTYKFDKSNDAKRPYDTSEKQRTPSWTDRILYRLGKEDLAFQVESCTSHEDILCSDHLPVSFSVRFRCH